MVTVTAKKTDNKKTDSVRQTDAKYCLVAGYDAFGSDSFNPSQYIVESLADNIKRKRL